MPTFTYLGKPGKPVPLWTRYQFGTAYANERLYDETREIHFAAEKVKQDRYFDTLKERADLSILLYDGHSNGSGTCPPSPNGQFSTWDLTSHSGLTEAWEGLWPIFGTSASSSAKSAHEATIWSQTTTLVNMVHRYWSDTKSCSRVVVQNIQLTTYWTPTLLSSRMVGTSCISAATDTTGWLHMIRPVPTA